MATLKPWIAKLDDEQRLWPGKRAAQKRAARIIRRDLENARARWIAEAENDPAETEIRQKSKFLSYYDDDRRQAGFQALRHPSLSRLGRSGASAKVMQRLARHSTVELTIGRYTHAGLYDLSSAVNALPPLPIAKQPERNQATLMATGTDNSVASPLASAGLKLAKKDDFSRLAMTHDGNGSTSRREKEKGSNPLGKEPKSEQSSDIKERRGRDSPPVPLAEVLLLLPEERI